jgi:hypothetical protein
MSIGANSNEIFRLNGISVSHAADLATKTTQISVLQSIQGGHATQITDNYNSIFTLNGTSLNHTNLLAGLRTDIDAVGSVSDSDIAALQSNISTINSTLTSHDNRIFTNTTDIFQLQTNGHGGRLDSVESTLTAYNTRITSNTVRGDDLLMASQFNSGLISAIDGQIISLRTDTDANTLRNTQFLNALQYQGDSIFAIDNAIQSLNGRVGVLETTQVTHADLLREFDQNFNDPATGVIFKINTLTTTYNAHIGGAFLDIRRNVDDNNLILGTLSTHTTSLLTAMTQIYTRVEDLKAYHP